MVERRNNCVKIKDYWFCQWFCAEFPYRREECPHHNYKMQVTLKDIRGVAPIMNFESFSSAKDYLEYMNSQHIDPKTKEVFPSRAEEALMHEKHSALVREKRKEAKNSTIKHRMARLLEIYEDYGFISCKACQQYAKLDFLELQRLSLAASKIQKAWKKYWYEPNKR